MSLPCDTHVHTSFSSDCSTPPEEVVRVADERGIGLVAITDHHDVRGWT
jgi:predicted metal-dependent phosphoesterase TrpH